MAIPRVMEEWVDNFTRAQALTTTPGFNGWTVADTSSGGTPTYLATSGVGMKLTLVSTSEAEIVDMHHNDVLQFDVDQLKVVDFWVKVAGIDSVTTLVFGMAGARDDIPDTVAQNCWFRVEGGTSTSNVVCETDDGTTDYDDKATGQTLSSTFKIFRIDFTNGKSDIRFYIGDSLGTLTRVAATTTFTLAAYTGQLQPYVQIQKASGIGVPSISIRRIRIEHQVIGG